MGNHPVVSRAEWVAARKQLLEKNGPHHNLMDWARHHDKYGFEGFVDATSLYRTGKVSYEARP